ncbi:amino acid ABC transporter permease [Saccharopolyspora sp. HNM0983]|uniref:Amino acid ABC transporter permease n=1 Tax=Saccharopolyspora montiporae TaxID=2781240 RepID=A0A929B7Z4_9PSEU|nr:amino acid ABC transporter permease [Saccharopolyspora sp. HNM0983]MBE9373106.1 amino acid ABC transporter permease [Saccharopolyspora sp. HNM0983]
MSTVLFDTPGPRARARNRLIGVISAAAVVLALGFVVLRFYQAGQFDAGIWEWILYKEIQLQLLGALWNTVRAFLSGAVLALVFGAVFALGRLSDHAWVRVPCGLIVELFRAIPLVIMIFFLYYAAPTLGLDFGQYWSVVLGLTLYNGSVLAEVFRSGVSALPKGQAEAAYSVGMRKSQVMGHVVLPQSVRMMLPAIVSQLVVLLKDSALGFLITYQELLYYARYLGSFASLDRPIIPVAMVVAAIYIVMCLLLAWLARYLERRNRRARKTSRLAPARPAEPAPGD